jgi:hypothetical protein
MRRSVGVVVGGVLGVKMGRKAAGARGRILVPVSWRNLPKLAGVNE